MTTKLEFLAQHSIFADLEDDELFALSQIAREFAFKENKVIVYQRDVADGLIIVKSGRLYAQEVDNQGIVRQTREYQDNDFFGAEYLFENGTQPATVTGTHEGRIMVIKGEDFRRFLISYPEAIYQLEPLVDEDGVRYAGLPAEAWERAYRLPLIEQRDHIGPIRLLPDELVEFESRRSTVVLMTSLLWPILGLVLAPMFAYFLIPTDTPASSTLRTVIILTSVLLFGFIIIFRLQDWRNDRFVITNKHISHREFELRTFHTQLHKVPVSQVQSVTVVKPTFIANLFNVGTVRITTASAVGTILFDGIDNPQEVERILENLRQRSQDTSAALAQSHMRKSVEQHFALEPGIMLVEGEDESVDDSLFAPAGQGGMGYRIWRSFGWRIEEGGVITYRRNYFILFWDIFLPAIAFILILASGALGYRYLTLDAGVIIIIALPLLFFNFVWLIWRYEDWRNDMFQLTQRDVIDIDRKPFGFGESRKQAPLNNIQNVTAERPGFFATIFDYGNVHIETAGAEAEIIFDKIPRPSMVLSDIFRRLDENRELEQRKDGDARREEYAVLLDVYKQEMEKGRIPRRTPD